ncbi:MAG: LysR substrate-binding domain-containing protein [Gammaproteobacteria bacterium]
MQDLPLNALRAFAAIYANGGIRAAARELDITHSSVSRHLAELETWLGVSLTLETAGRRTLTFTPQGEALGQALQQHFKEITHAVASLREAKSVNSVTISTTPSFAARWLLPRIPDFERVHPKIEISVLIDQRIINPDTGNSDLAIRIGRGPWADTRCEPLMDDELYPVMSPAFWKSSGRPNKPGELVGLRLLHDRDPQATWESWRKIHGPARLDVRSGPRFASSDLVLRAAAQGQGIALARHRLAADDIASGTLARPLPGLSVKIGAAYWVVLPAHGVIRPAVLKVVDWLKKLASSA